MRADAIAKEAAKKAKEAALLAEFNRIAGTNDGMLRIEAARKRGDPLPGDPRAKEFIDADEADDSGEDADAAPKMLSDEVVRCSAAC